MQSLYQMVFSIGGTGDWEGLRRRKERENRETLRYCYIYESINYKKYYFRIVLWKTYHAASASNGCVILGSMREEELEG
jgi:hypothetical protein